MGSEGKHALRKNKSEGKNAIWKQESEGENALGKMGSDGVITGGIGNARKKQKVEERMCLRKNGK